MGRINVTVKDTTVNDNNIIVLDSPAVYVIGFTENTGNSDIYFNPTYCDTLDKFYDVFGSATPAYGTTYKYFGNFSPTAYGDAEDTLCVAGDPDKGYTYALNMLKAGLPVIYEAVAKTTIIDSESGQEVPVNDVSLIYKYLAGKFDSEAIIAKKLLETQPSDWTTNYFNYFDAKGNPVTGVCPDFTLRAYYQRSLSKNSSGEYTYDQLMDPPGDWATNYFSYYQAEFREGKNYYFNAVGQAPLFETGKYYEGTVIHESIPSPFDKNDGSLSNLNEYNAQFLTTGGLPILEHIVNGTENLIASKMCELAAFRGDCLALIDHTDYADRKFVDSTYGLDAAANRLGITDNGNAAIFTPWGQYDNMIKAGTTIPFFMPASYGFLKAYAKSIQGNDEWLAIAGVNRGRLDTFVPHVNKMLTNKIADILVNNSTPVNAITNIHNYGQTIYGNNTLLSPNSPQMAKQKINITTLTSLVVKRARELAVKYLFEQNTDALFQKFKAEMMPLLDSMVTGNGLRGYKILKDLETSTKTCLGIIIRIYPIYAVESINIMVHLTDEEIEIETE